MTSVTLPPEPESERGQMMLVGAFTLGVVLVVLAVMLNAAIFTENVATRGGDIIGGQEAEQFHAAIERGSQGVVVGLNYADDSTTYDFLHENLTDEIDAVETVTSRQFALDSTSVNVTVTEQTNGTRLFQDEDRNFSDDEENHDWQVLGDEGVSGDFSVRDFVFALNITEMSNGATLWVKIDEGSGGIDRTIQMEKASGNLELQVLDGGTGGSSLGTCSASPTEDYVTVSITNDSVAESHCAALADNVDTGAVEEIEFEETTPTEPVGQYSIIVNETHSDVDTSDFDGSTTPLPNARQAIWSATANVTYETTRLEYSDTVELVPEEKSYRDIGIGQTSVVKSGGSSSGGSGGSTSVGNTIVFADKNDNLRTFASSASSTEDGYSVTDASIVANKPVEMDGDGRDEVAYVDSNKNLKIVDNTGSSDKLVSSNVKKQKTIIHVGTFNTSTKRVFYVDTNGNLKAVDESGTVTTIWDSQQVTHLVGIADIDGDGSDELVWYGDSTSGSSDHLVWIEEDGSVSQLDTGSTSFGGFGSNNNGIGLGEPADFNGNGTARIPYVDGSGNLKLLGAEGSTETIVSGGKVSKSPVGAVDWDGDDTPEIVYVASSGNKIKWVDDVTGSNTVDKVGNNEKGSGTAGARSITSDSPEWDRRFSITPVGGDLHV